MLTEKVVTDQDVYDYLGIDEADDMISRRVARLRKMSASYLNQSVGKHVDDKHPVAQELALALIGDNYDNRGTQQRVTLQTRRMIRDFCLVLIMEGRGDGVRQDNPDSEVESGDG